MKIWDEQGVCNLAEISIEMLI